VANPVFFIEKVQSICLRWNEPVQFLSLKLRDFTTLNMHLHLTDLKAKFVMMTSELRYKIPVRMTVA